MRPVFVRPVTPEDADLFAEWQKDRPNFDPAAVRYPDSFTLAAFDDSGVLAFLPVQQPQMMLETIAFRPGLTPMAEANVMREFVQAAVLLGHLKGTGEIYFLGDSDATNRFAENYLFERMPWPVYKLRLSNLTKAAT